MLETHDQAQGLCISWQLSCHCTVCQALHSALYKLIIPASTPADYNASIASIQSCSKAVGMPRHVLVHIVTGDSQADTWSPGAPAVITRDYMPMLENTTRLLKMIAV